MRYERILRKVNHEPWLITKEAHASILALIESKLAQSIFEKDGKFIARPETDFFGEPLPQMTFDENRIATIPIRGVIGQGFGAFEKSCGAVDTGDIADEIDEANSRGAKAIILDFDSPGGTVNGTPELADKIAASQRDGGAEIYSFTGSMIASAAYWIASSAFGGIYATKMADIGSIGVYMPWKDQTKRFEMMGVRVELIKSGKLKGAGYPGTSLTEDQRADFQNSVDQTFQMFAEHVRGYRKDVPDSAMQGQTMFGKDALNAHLIDGIVGGISEVKAKILSAK